MSNGVENSSQTLSSPYETTELNTSRSKNMSNQNAKNTSSHVVTHQSISEQKKFPTDPIFKQVERLCVILTEKDNLNSTGNSNASGYRRDEATSSSTNAGMRMLNVCLSVRNYFSVFRYLNILFFPKQFS